MREQRKVVTILFADVVGSTALAAQSDPEVVRATMARYFQRIAEVAEAYGGTVEKFAGDAAMVIFGVPAVHDDDAERAVRAALEIRDGAAELAVRVGVNTGEAVTAAREDRQFMVSGDAVNVAARLQQGAEPGEVVVGPLTEQLTRNVIDYESHDAVAAKGKSIPLVAFRAVRARSIVPEQARGVPGLHASLVGRDRELRLMLDTYARTAQDRRSYLFTLVGAAGVGKSRLVAEVLSGLASSGARVLRGRCLPYGRGITYWPLIEMLRQDTGISLTDERDLALLKLDRWLGELLHDDPQRPAIRARLSVMLGFEAPESVMPDTPAERVERELGWAMRHYFEALATAAPLIVVMDDMQWAEAPVATMIDQLVERVTDAPMLVVCIARPEFLEQRRDWSSGKPNSTTITLDPLNPTDTGTLISRLLEIEALPPDLRAQIIERSAGTPLFCEEFIHMLIDDGSLVRDGTSWRTTSAVAQIQVPQSINAVLAARLDGLPERERHVLQAASVVGQRFEMRQLKELAGGSDLEEIVESLQRKGLVAGGDGAADDLRFRHLLIRDAAYGSMPKSERATLHDRFGTKLEEQAGDPQQLTEILAYHAERAFTLSSELGVEGDALHDRARRALHWSLAMADRARTRNDNQILEETLRSLRAAAEALPDGGGDAVRAQLRLLDAQLMVMKADYRGAQQAAAEAAALAEQANLPAVVVTARLTEAWIWNWSGGEDLHGHFQQLVNRAIEASQQAGDVSGEIEARHIASNIQFGLGRLDEFVEINQRLLAQARSIGDDAHAASILDRLTAVEQLRGNKEIAARYLIEVDELANRLGLRRIALNVMRTRGIIALHGGDAERAESLFRQFVAAAADAGSVQAQISALRFLGYALRQLHRFSEMAQALDRAIELSESSGERWNRAEVLAVRARAALELGEVESADRFIHRALEAVREDDVTGISEVHDHLGMILAAKGDFAGAETALRRSLEVVGATEFLWPKGYAAIDLAKFLAQRGRPAEAVAVLDQFAQSNAWGMWDSEIEAIHALVKAASGTD